LNTPSFDFIKFVDTPQTRDNDQIMRQKFYRIQAPPGIVDFDKPETWASAWPSWNNDQKLYAVQRYLVTRIINLTKDHWKRHVRDQQRAAPGRPPEPPASERGLLFEVASWMDGLLWMRISIARKRLVMLNLWRRRFPNQRLEAAVDRHGPPPG